MKIQLLLTVSSLALLVAGCGIGNKVTVNGVVKESGGAVLDGAQVQILDTVQCCAGVDKPCTYTTDSAGKWSLFVNTGRANKDAGEARETCQYTVSKSGFTSATGSFNYCIRGECSGEQTVSTESTLSP